MRGVDFASYENFTSFCLQDYPKYEILFCVNDLDDAAVPLIRRLAEEFPQRSIRLLSNAPQLGSNHKVNNLALLASQAKYELLVQSDGDVRVGRELLARDGGSIRARRDRRSELLLSRSGTKKFMGGNRSIGRGDGFFRRRAVGGLDGGCDVRAGRFGSDDEDVAWKNWRIRRAGEGAGGRLRDRESRERKLAGR